MFKEFTKENPDVTLHMTQIPEGDFPAKMTAAISAGKVPDLVYLFSEFQPGLLATNGFSPVPDGLVREDDFFPSAWKTSVVDGKQYGVPWYAYARVFQYRSDIAEAAGVKAPTDWASLQAFGEGLKAEGVEQPLTFYVHPFDSYSAAQLDVIAHQNGGGFLSSDGSKWTIDSTENVKALEYYASLFHDGLASPDGPSSTDSVPLITNGTVGSVTNGPWYRGWLKDANGSDWVSQKMATAGPIAGPDGTKAAAIGGGSWAVPKDAKNASAAWKFVRYMSSKKAQVEWYKVFNNLPAVASAWDDPAIAGDNSLDAVRSAIEVGVSVPNASTWDQVAQAVAQQMERVVRGQANAKDALAEAQSEAEAIGTGPGK